MSTVGLQHISAAAQKQAIKKLAEQRVIGNQAVKIAKDNLAFFKANYKSLPKGPNKTEQQARAILEATGQYIEIRFEAITLKLKNGMKYKPDWLCVPNAEPIEAVKKPNSDEYVVTTISRPITLAEIKNGAYRHASHGRSMMALAQAKLDFPMFNFVLMTKQCDGTWRTE